MIEHGTHRHVNVAFEIITDETTKENRINYACYQIINNTLCHYETAFKIALILGQLLDHNDMLKSKHAQRKT